MSLYGFSKLGFFEFAEQLITVKERGLAIMSTGSADYS